MAKFQVDLKDIYFCLFEVLKIQKDSPSYDVQQLKQIIEEYTKFCENEIFPTRLQSDVEGVHLLPQGVKVPEVLKRATKLYYENGWFGLGLPEELGGIPMPEAVYSACMSIGTASNTAWMMYPGLCRAAFNVIHKIGNQLQQDLFLPNILSGKWGGTMCLTENDAGSDVGALRTMATPIGGGKFKIKGVKIFISSGDNDLYENIIHLVLARTPQGGEGTKGLSLFIVPKIRVNADGSLGAPNDVLCTKVEEKMGIHASATCELSFGGNDQCEGFLIGKEFEGMPNMFVMMNEARLTCGIQGESQANLAFAMTEQYARERLQFGQEIVHHPDVKRMMFKMRAMGRGLRALCSYTASLLEKAHGGEAQYLNEIELMTPICKAYATDEGFKVCVEAVQVHGGYGYCQDYGIEQFVRDSKIATIYEGTNGIQARDFVMRKIIKDNGTALKILLGKIKNSVHHWPAPQWEKETELMTTVGAKLEKIVESFFEYNARKETNRILVRCTDFLAFCGHYVVAWTLGEAAKTAHESLQKTDDKSDHDFFRSKILDFKVFCNNYLILNLSLAEVLLSYDIRLEENHI